MYLSDQGLVWYTCNEVRPFLDTVKSDYLSTGRLLVEVIETIIEEAIAV